MLRGGGKAGLKDDEERFCSSARLPKKFGWRSLSCIILQQGLACRPQLSGIGAVSGSLEESIGGSLGGGSLTICGDAAVDAGIEGVALPMVDAPTVEANGEDALAGGGSCFGGSQLLASSSCVSAESQQSSKRGCQQLPWFAFRLLCEEREDVASGKAAACFRSSSSTFDFDISFVGSKLATLGVGDTAISTGSEPPVCAHRADLSTPLSRRSSCNSLCSPKMASFRPSSSSSVFDLTFSTCDSGTALSGAAVA